MVFGEPNFVFPDARYPMISLSAFKGFPRVFAGRSATRAWTRTSMDTVSPVSYLRRMRCSPKTMALWIPQKQGASLSWIASTTTVSMRLVTGHFRVADNRSYGYLPEFSGPWQSPRRIFAIQHCLTRSRGWRKRWTMLDGWNQLLLHGCHRGKALPPVFG
jgi:hypothetical protein